MSDREIDKISTQLQHLAPAAWSTTTHVVQIGAIGYLLAAASTFIAFTVIGLVLLAIGVRTARKRDRIAAERGGTSYSDPNPSGWYIATGFCGVSLLATFLVMMFSPWAWISAVHPDLGAAHQILSRIGIQ